MKPLAQGHMAREPRTQLRGLRRLRSRPLRFAASLHGGRGGRGWGRPGTTTDRRPRARGPGRAEEGRRAGAAAGLTLALCTASCAPRSCSQMRAGSGSSDPSAPSTARLTPNRPSMRPRLRSSSAAFSAGAVNSSSTARAAMAGAASRGGAGGRRRRRPLSVLPLCPSPSGGVGPPGHRAPPAPRRQPAGLATTSRLGRRGLATAGRKALRPFAAVAAGRAASPRMRPPAAVIEARRLQGRGGAEATEGDVTRTCHVC